MNPESLAKELDRDPFVPLRVHLADGRHVDVLNPRNCFIARLTLYVFAAQPRQTLADDAQLISLRGIVSVKPIAPSQAA